MADNAYDYTDEASRRVARKRRLAQLLQEQSMGDMPLPKGTPVSALAPLAQMFKAYVGEKMAEQADIEGRQNQEAQDTAFNKAVDDARGIPTREGMGPHESLSNAAQAAAAPQDLPNDLGPWNKVPQPSLGARMLGDQSPLASPSYREPLDTKPDAAGTAPPEPVPPSFMAQQPKPAPTTDPLTEALLKPSTNPSMGDMALLDQGKDASLPPLLPTTGAPFKPPTPLLPQFNSGRAAAGVIKGLPTATDNPFANDPFTPMKVSDTYKVNPNPRNLIGDMGEPSAEEKAAAAYADANKGAAGKMAGGGVPEIPPEVIAAAGGTPQPLPTGRIQPTPGPAPGPIPAMPAPAPTPPPTLASLGAPPPGSAPGPLLPTAPTFEKSAPPIPFAPPSPPLQGAAPAMPMLPAQPGLMSTTEGMMQFLRSLPPGQLKNRLIDETMKEVVKEPARVRELQQTADIEAQKSRDTRYGVDERERAGAASNAATIRAAEIRAAHDRSANRQLVGLDIDNVPVSYDPHTGQLTRADGKPPKGAVMSISAIQKDAAAGRTVEASISKAQDLLKTVEDNKGAFGGWGSAGIDIANVFGPQARGWATKMTYTQDEQIARATVAAQAADVLHQLYGAALTKGEEAKAAKFVYEVGEPPEVTISKINSMLQILGYKKGALSPQAQGAIRQGGDPYEEEMRKRGFIK